MKKLMLLILASGLLSVVACTSTQPWWKGKPVSQMTPAELEEQDPEFWYFWKNFHEVP